LWFLHRWTGVSVPNTALIAVRRAFEPSMTNKRLRVGSTPCATKCWSKSLAASAFSVAPSRSASTCLRPLDIHIHGGQHALIPKAHPVDVDDQQLDLIESPLQQPLQGGLGSLDRFPAHRRSRYAHRIGHFRNYTLIAPHGYALQQNLK